MAVQWPGNLLWKNRAHEKINSRVSPCLLLLTILKTAFMGNMELWSGRHWHQRLRYRRRHRRSQCNVQTKY
jgi:hypothetical protein